MSDPSAHHASDDGQDRTAKIEELLLAGLDHYFAGEHDRAISIWTRVLFLDRGHARARAYIDRARGALAERQRESEELIQQGMAAFDQGEATTARRLLSSAVAHGGPHDVALALLDRLNRLEAGTSAVPGASHEVAAGRAPAAARRRSSPRRLGMRVFGAMLLAVILGAAALYLSFGFPGLGPDQRSGSLKPRRSEETLPLPRSADLALARARSLAAAGRLKEALAGLQAIAPGDQAHPGAETLRAEIQAALLLGLPPVAADTRPRDK